MNILKRSFTRREKILLVVLAAVVLAGVYYVMVFEPVQSGVAQAKGELALIQVQLDSQRMLADERQKLLDELETLDGSGSAQLAAYDNQSEVIKLFGELLYGISDYTLSFAQLSEESGLIRRPVTLAYTADGYRDVSDVVGKLMDCPFRCDVEAFSVTPVTSGMLNEGKVSVRVDVVFYEIEQDGGVTAG